MVLGYLKKVIRHLTGASVDNSNSNSPLQTPSGSENRSGNDNDSQLQPTVEDKSTFSSDDQTSPNSTGHRTATNDPDQSFKTEKEGKTDEKESDQGSDQEVKTVSNDQKEKFDQDVKTGENDPEESSAGDEDWTIQDEGRRITINKERITFEDDEGNSLILNNNNMEFTRSDGIIVKAHGWTYEKSIKELYGIVWDSPNAYKSTRRRATIFGTSNSGNSIFRKSNTGNTVFGNSNTGNSVFGKTNTGNSVFGGSNTGNSIFAGTNTGNTVYGSTNTGRTLFGRLGHRVSPGSFSCLGYRNCPMNLKDWNSYTADEQLSGSYYWIGDLLWRVFSGEDVSDENTVMFSNSEGVQVFGGVEGNVGGQYVVGNHVFPGNRFFSGEGFQVLGDMDGNIGGEDFVGNHVYSGIQLSGGNAMYFR